MKLITLTLSNLRPLQFVIVAFACALILLSSAFPGFAISRN